MPASLTARRLGAVALSALLSVSLAACSGGDKTGPGTSSSQAKPGTAAKSSSASTFDFTRAVMFGARELDVDVPNGLKAAMGSSASTLLVQSFHLSAKPLGGASYCAVDVKPDYAPGGYEKAVAPEPVDSTDQQRAASALKTLDASVQKVTAKAERTTGKRGEEALVEVYGPLDEEGRKNDPKGMTRPSFIEDVRQASNGEISTALTDNYREPKATSYSEVTEKFRSHLKDLSMGKRSTTPGQNAAARIFGESQSNPMSDLSTANPTTGVYVSDDGRSAVLVASCATDPRSTEDTVRLVFPLSDKQASTLAEANISIMKDGAVSVVKSKVEGYQVDASGNWLKK